MDKFLFLCFSFSSLAARLMRGKILGLAWLGWVGRNKISEMARNGNGRCGFLFWFWLSTLPLLGGLDESISSKTVAYLFRLTKGESLSTIVGKGSRNGLRLVVQLFLLCWLCTESTPRQIPQGRRWMNLYRPCLSRLLVACIPFCPEEGAWQPTDREIFTMLSVVGRQQGGRGRNLVGITWLGQQKRKSRRCPRIRPSSTPQPQNLCIDVRDKLRQVCLRRCGPSRHPCRISWNRPLVAPGQLT